MYEYFFARFAGAEGKNGGQFYTPSHVVRVLVEVLAPYKGRVYDPRFGPGGMFVQSEKFIEANAGKIGQIAHGDTFHNDRHPDLKADYVLANPPSTTATGAASY